MTTTQKAPFDTDKVITVYVMKDIYRQRINVPDQFKAKCIGVERDKLCFYSPMTSIDGDTYIWFVENYKPDGKTICQFWMFSSSKPTEGTPYWTVKESGMFDTVQITEADYYINNVD